MNLFAGIQDLMNGTQIRLAYHFLKRSEKWPEEKVNAYKLQKLRKLLAHAYQHVPYYRDLFDSHHLQPEDIADLSDFEEIPVLTKEIIRQEGSRMFAQNYKINNRKIKKSKTGGTTGPPLLVYKDVTTRNFTWGAYYRWYDWMGIKPGDKVVFLWGYPKVLSRDGKTGFINLIRKHFANTNIINAFKLSEERIPLVVEEILRYRPVLIRGYLSAILLIGNYIKKNKISIKDLKAISTTTETLSPHYREILEEIYGVPVFDQYGCSECGSIAFECERQEGLHLTEEHVHIEVLDEHNAPILYKPGNITLTDLDNYFMPFIRYKNGDIGKLSGDRCSCGRNSRLLTSIDGRATDTVVLKDGSAVHGVFFTDILYEMKNKESLTIRRFQIFQKEVGKIEFRIEGNRDQISKSFLNELQDHLDSFFHQAEIRVVEKLLAEKSGKFKYIKSQLS